MSHQNEVSSECVDMNAVDDDYFVSYDDVTVHKLMLKDEPRVLAYKRFIEENQPLFADKVVVDVGAGTGILSLLSARAGAKHVYAIEAAPNIAALCQDIVETNNYSDRITVLTGRVEDISLPDDIKADVLISEWMGFYLLHESMLSSFVAARDKFLDADGVVFPSAASLYVCPVSLKEFARENFDFWHKLYGFDFSPAARMARAGCLGRPEIMSVNPNSLLAEPQSILDIDLRYVANEDVANICATLDFKSLRNDVLHGFALWFDVTFEGDVTVVLDTSPSSPETHWKQTVILLPDALLVNRDSSLPCRIDLRQAENKRRYDITLEMIDDDDDDDDDQEEVTEEVPLNEDTEGQAVEELILNAMVPTI